MKKKKSKKTSNNAQSLKASRRDKKIPRPDESPSKLAQGLQVISKPTQYFLYLV